MANPLETAFAGITLTEMWTQVGDLLGVGIISGLVILTLAIKYGGRLLHFVKRA